MNGSRGKYTAFCSPLIRGNAVSTGCVVVYGSIFNRNGRTVGRTENTAQRKRRTVSQLRCRIKIQVGICSTAVGYSADGRRIVESNVTVLDNRITSSLPRYHTSVGISRICTETEFSYADVKIFNRSA